MLRPAFQMKTRGRGWLEKDPLSVTFFSVILEGTHGVLHPQAGPEVGPEAGLGL